MERRSAIIVAARRTAVVPRGGALSRLQADELAAPVIDCLLADTGRVPRNVDHVILGNALYGGGNPARMAALRAGLPQGVPALTVDTQCCSGLDAIMLAVRLVEAGAADCILAGGAESFSRAPIRMKRALSPAEPAVPYDRPPFAPPPYADPELADAAAKLAAARGLTRQAQAEFAVASHRKATAAQAFLQTRMVTDRGSLPDRDGFTRDLSLKTALRAPVLAGPVETGLGAATIACEADAAALVMVLSERAFARHGGSGLKVLAARGSGDDPDEPALAPVALARNLMADLKIGSRDLAAVEVMEAYAVQAMATASDLGIDPDSLNRHGGGLARGHPIGASGAILAVNLFDLLSSPQDPAEPAQAFGMALIAAAGGLGSALVVQAVTKKAG